MKKFIYLILFGILAFGFNSCEEDEFTSNLNYVSFQSTSLSFGVDLGSSSSQDITVYTTQSSSSARTFNITVASGSADAAAYTVPATVTIPANSKVGTFTVTIADVNIDADDGETLVLAISATDGATSPGSNITLNIYQVCPLNEVVFYISFDSYPEESYWELRNSNNVVIYSADEGDYAGEDSFRKAFCLDNGTYTFTMFDAWGDGSGPYYLLYNGTKFIDSDGGFGTSETTTFTVNM
jgi:hypothetical protein